MISKINRLRKKKGFTIIELIVVIAIIGVLASIMVATMSYDNRPSVGKSLAKDLYYVAQDAALRVKVTHPNAFNDATKFPTNSAAGYYVKVGPTGYIEEICSYTVKANLAALIANVTYSSTSVNIDDPHDITYDKSQADDFNAFENAIVRAIKDYLVTKDGFEGAYYINFDKNFRVMSAYWTSQKDKITGAHEGFPSDYTMSNGYLCCSYPVKYCLNGSLMFIK